MDGPLCELALLGSLKSIHLNKCSKVCEKGAAKGAVKGFRHPPWAIWKSSQKSIFTHRVQGDVQIVHAKFGCKTSISLSSKSEQKTVKQKGLIYILSGASFLRSEIGVEDVLPGT